MKVHFTTAARIAEASMEMTWRENILLFISVAVTPLLSLGILALAMVVGMAGFVGGLVIIAVTWTAVMAYAETITYAGVAMTCIVAAWLFAKARETKPRKFFDYLARGGFWYFTSIAAILCFAGFSRFVDAYGWPIAIGAVLATGAALKLLEFAFKK